MTYPAPASFAGDVAAAMGESAMKDAEFEGGEELDADFGAFGEIPAPRPNGPEAGLPSVQPGRQVAAFEDFAFGTMDNAVPAMTEPGAVPGGEKKRKRRSGVALGWGLLALLVAHRRGAVHARAAHGRRHAAGRPAPLRPGRHADECARAHLRRRPLRLEHRHRRGRADGRGRGRQRHLGQRRGADRGGRAPRRGGARSSRNGRRRCKGSSLPRASTRPSRSRSPRRRKPSAASRSVSPPLSDGAMEASGAAAQDHAALQRRGHRQADRGAGAGAGRGEAHRSSHRRRAQGQLHLRRRSRARALPSGARAGDRLHLPRELRGRHPIARRGGGAARRHERIDGPRRGADRRHPRFRPYACLRQSAAARPRRAPACSLAC